MTENATVMRKYLPSVVWTYRSLEPCAYAMIRFSTGAILATHGVARLFSSNASFGFNHYLAGLPLTGVGAFELIGGALLALGLLTRPVALLTGLLWLFFTLGHTPGGRPGSWFMLGAIDHFPAFVTFLCLAFVCRGGGHYSLDRRMPKEF